VKEKKRRSRSSKFILQYLIRSGEEMSRWGGYADEIQSRTKTPEKKGQRSPVGRVEKRRIIGTRLHQKLFRSGEEVKITKY